MKTNGLLFGLILACITVLSGPASAQIYRSTDADGNVIFTDTPPPGGPAEQVNLQHTNTAEPTVVPPPVGAETSAAQGTENTLAQVVVITSPANDETIPQGAAGNFTVIARVEPDLVKGQSLRLSFDGTPTGKLMQSGFWDLEAVDRGTHNLTVSIVDSEGATVSESRPVQVHVMRTAIRPSTGPR